MDTEPLINGYENGFEQEDTNIDNVNENNDDEESNTEIDDIIITNDPVTTFRDEECVEEQTDIDNNDDGNGNENNANIREIDNVNENIAYYVTTLNTFTHHPGVFSNYLSGNTQILDLTEMYIPLEKR